MEYIKSGPVVAMVWQVRLVVEVEVVVVVVEV